MSQFFSDLFLFLYSILSHWQAYATGGIVTGLVGIFERLSKWQLTKRAYAGLFLGVFLFAAFFLAWRDAHMRLQKEQVAHSDTLFRLAKLESELNDERKKNNAKFQGEIMYASWASPVTRDFQKRIPNKTVVVCFIAIRNIGGADSIVDSYRLEIDIPGKGRITDVPVHAPNEPITVYMVDGRAMEFEGEKQIFYKTEIQPVSAGGKVEGVLIFLLDDVAPETARDANQSMRIICSDVAGNLYTFAPNWKGNATGNYFWSPGIEPKSFRPKQVPPFMQP